MGRIRTLKPELPQDEKVGSVTRDARLCWLMLFTLADDEGRLRAHPALLGGSLFPYDGLEPAQVEAWLVELEAAGLLRRWRVNGECYADIPNWSSHQKIERPTPSRLPSFDSRDAEDSPTSHRGLTEDSPRTRASRARTGPRTVDLGSRTVLVASTEATALSEVNPQAPQDYELVVSGTREIGKDEVEAVFMAWKEAGGLNGRTVLTADRRRKILARLREYPLVDVIDAARGIWESEWHREHGQTDLSLALRDAAHLERFRDVRRGLRPRGDPEPMGVQAKAMKRALEDGTVDTELLRWAYSPEGIAATTYRRVHGEG